jgi:hypothetical protein
MQRDMLGRHCIFPIQMFRYQWCVFETTFQSDVAYTDISHPALAEPRTARDVSERIPVWRLPLGNSIFPTDQPQESIGQFPLNSSWKAKTCNIPLGNDE